MASLLHGATGTTPDLHGATLSDTHPRPHGRLGMGKAADLACWVAPTFTCGRYRRSRTDRDPCLIPSRARMGVFEHPFESSKKPIIPNHGNTTLSTTGHDSRRLYQTRFRAHAGTQSRWNLTQGLPRTAKDCQGEPEPALRRINRPFGLCITSTATGQPGPGVAYRGCRSCARVAGPVAGPIASRYATHSRAPAGSRACCAAAPG